MGIEIVQFLFCRMASIVARVLFVSMCCRHKANFVYDYIIFIFIFIRGTLRTFETKLHVSFYANFFFQFSLRVGTSLPS